MRKEPEESSEMVNQVLFGESFTIIDEFRPKNFSLIRLHHDNYEGWINSGCIHTIADEDFSHYQELPSLLTHEVLSQLYCAQTDEIIIVGCGSILRTSPSGSFIAGKSEFQLQETVIDPPGNAREKLVQYGLKLVSVPYLWGGRSSFGFDCSGLCQNLFSQIGIGIPRDSSAQSAAGHSLIFIDEAKPGDLAFFDNEEGQIIHVGMIIDDGRILHASGRVKIDQIDHQGIFSTEKNRYTHNLRVMKNLID